MIGLHENYLPHKYPAFKDQPAFAPPAAVLCAQLTEQIAKEYQKLVNLTFRAAIIEKCGFLPSVEEMAARGKCVVTSDGKRLLLWDHPPLEIGSDIDPSYVIASVEPPK
jgi:hypothetical protein